MILKKTIRFSLFIWFAFTITQVVYAPDIENTFYLTSDVQTNSISGVKKNINRDQPILEKLNYEFQASISIGDTATSGSLLKEILRTLRETRNDNLTSSNSHYFIGVYYLINGNYSEAINWLKLSSSMRIQIGTYDETYAKCLYNLGIAYSKLGDYRQMEQYMLQSLEIEKQLYGELSTSLISGLSALVTASIGLNEYNRAISYGNNALNLINGAGKADKPGIAILYTNIGACHARLSDYSKARLYLEEAESIYRQHSLPVDENYINLLNSLAATYFFLGLNEKADEYFNKGIDEIGTSNSVISLNFLNSFAVILGNSGNTGKGEALLKSSLAKAEGYYGTESRDYFEVVKNYADYLRIFRIDLKKSMFLYEQCIDYITDHEEDNSLKDPVYLGYALALADNSDPEKALAILQKLLFPNSSLESSLSSVDNPEIELIEPVQFSINLLKAKYRILWDLYRKFENNKYLLAASETSELIIALLERVRINISEEESRLVLGDRYRDSYLYTIRDFELCHRLTGRKEFLDKAFEYAEKSKVAGLLASTRELKATQFHIPADIGDLEKKLKTEISFYEARISDENMKSSPDATLISEWKGIVLNAIQKRDSLLTLFEESYPEYYSIKYNTEVIKPGDISHTAGRNTNYLNYVVSDSVLYIFVANRKNMKLITVPVDSVFFENVREFRNLLSMPIGNAKSDFLKYTTIGGRIYNLIIEPVKKYLISNKLLISPDNILSYIPFEALPTRPFSDGNILYNNIPFLMKDFSISYTYSATLLAESQRKNFTRTNSLIAFAPVYTGTISIDSVLNSRQAGKSVLRDLKFARMEAEYVAELTGGKLFINNGAKESVFKSEAGKYDIIHLAMHTVLNDQFPMYSKMLFYQGIDSIEDGNLNTYEVYGVPLKAKMVILSSCNTGNGLLHSGEGILSLARGFIYSGGQSVIMSMWEIEDKSGAEIVKNFYRYLKKGATKSNALRKARIEYLKNADMLRSHPYFWSSLVVYGNNAPLYHSIKSLIIIVSVILLLTFILIVYYFRFR